MPVTEILGIEANSPEAFTDSQYLYIDSGTENIYPPGQNDLVSRALPYTLSIPLTSSWTNSTVKIGTIQKPSDLVIWDNAALWNGLNNSFIQFGGEKVDVHYIPSPDPPLSVWSMTPSGNGNGTWSEMIPPTDSVWRNLTRPNAGLHSQNSKLQAYYLGGYVSNWTSPSFHNTPNTAPIPISGLVSYDPTSNSWKNTSSAGYSEYGNGIRGAMQATTIFGDDDGILVMAGGDIGGRTRHYFQGTALRGMDNITIYDITNDQWYHQTATGDIPPPRIDMCVVGVSEPGSGTYEIFMVGGFNGYFGPGNSNYTAVYVLSLPAFHWMRAGNTNTQPRAGHSCVAAGNSSQMIVIGGFDPSQPNLNASAQIPDPFAQGLGIFNMTSMIWQDHYDGGAIPYKSSNEIKQWYNSTTSDLSPGLAVPATYTPPKGWTQPGLQTVMQRNANAPPKSTPSPSPPPARSSKAGAIAGGVIGGVVGLALILLAIQVTLRRRRHHLDKYREQQRSQSGKRPGEVPSPTHPIELPGSSWNEHSKNDRPGRSMTEILFSKRRNVDYCNDIQRQNDSGGGIRTGELEGESVAHELDTDPRRSSMF